MDENDRRALQEQNQALNRWANQVLYATLKGKRVRRMSYAQAWLDAQKARLRMKMFGHY